MGTLMRSSIDEIRELRNPPYRLTLRDGQRRDREGLAAELQYMTAMESKQGRQRVLLVVRKLAIWINGALTKAGRTFQQPYNFADRWKKRNPAA